MFIPYHTVWLRGKLRGSASLLVIELSANTWSSNAEPLAHKIVESPTFWELCKYVPKTMNHLANKSSITPETTWTVEADAGVAAANELHRENSILRHTNCRRRCSMYCPVTCHGNAMGSNKNSDHGHGLGRVEIDAMVLASSQLS